MASLFAGRRLSCSPQGPFLLRLVTNITTTTASSILTSVKEGRYILPFFSLHHDQGERGVERSTIPTHLRTGYFEEMPTVLSSSSAFERNNNITSTSTSGDNSSTSSPGLWLEGISNSGGGGVVFCTTPFLRKDVRRGDRGESHRLTFEERADRRSGKSKELRIEKEQHAEELQRMVIEEFPQELEALFSRIHRLASREALKVQNVAKCVEGIEVEVPGQEHQQIPLGSIGQLVKINAQTMELSLPSPAMLTVALQRISRLDGTWQVTKETGGGGAQKIKIVIPPLTTQNREKAAEKIRHHIAIVKQKAKVSRTNVVKLLQRNASLVEEGIISELTRAMDATYESFVQEKTEELEAMIEELLMTNKNDENADEEMEEGGSVGNNGRKE